ncbi:hypothetical protein BDQ12DRAFT_74710 [Crucibulum laeve]|uniref:Uncharacterized protein n=1 Tax=Crucibulum laeve TaxID=68775 RepID=A0A5C3M1F5_9AGAR|nr:hypothetical protein BDQ12DRAFT_74710 [Crucibulum laeve]
MPEPCQSTSRFGHHLHHCVLFRGSCLKGIQSWSIVPVPGIARVVTVFVIDDIGVARSMLWCSSVLFRTGHSIPVSKLSFRSRIFTGVSPSAFWEVPLRFAFDVWRQHWLHSVLPPARISAYHALRLCEENDDRGSDVLVHSWVGVLCFS